MACEIDPGFDFRFVAAALDRAKQLRDVDFPIDTKEIATLRQWTAPTSTIRRIPRP